MEELCRMNEGKKYTNYERNIEFQPFKAVIQVVKGTLKEVHVSLLAIGNGVPYTKIECEGVSLLPKGLTISASRVSASELLLNIEVCKFVMEANRVKHFEQFERQE